MPPGLPLPHGHPAASLVKESSVTSSPSPAKSQPTIAPPPGLTPPQKIREVHTLREASPIVPESPVPSKTVHVNHPAAVSTGSPKQKATVTAVKETKSQTSSKNSKNDKAGKGPSREHHSKPKPIKLDISFSNTPRETESPSQSSAPYQLPALPASLIGSRPNTPGTMVPRASESTAARQPRVLRVIDTPKSGTPPPQPSSAASGSGQASKQRSRRPSISSVSRPATPAEASSEYDPYTSASASRANSPPPSRIGSAPIRAMTKNQLRKQRKLKAEQVEAKKEEESVVSATDDAIQAPILGRKRKTKKPSKRPMDALEDGQKTPSVLNEEPEGKESVSSTPKQPESAYQNDPKIEDKAEQKEEHEPWRDNNTLEQLIIDAEDLGVPIKELFLERTSPLPTILAQLFKSGELDLHVHPLFNSPNLNQRVDMKCTADDYEFLKQPIELTEEDRKALLRGEPVRINGDSELLKHRCLITPRGCILRHLSAEEEDHYLALEQTLASAIDAGHDYPALVITEPDKSNRGGGLDALFATPEKFNIRWVDDDASRSGLITGTTTDSVLLSNASGQGAVTTPPNVFSALEADTARSTSWAIPSNNADAMGASASSNGSSAPPRSSATAKSMMSGSTTTFGPDLEELMNVPDSELRSMIEAAQRELEVSRKDVDIVDKRITALVKRNKKLVQQALAAALDFVSSGDADA